MLIILESIFALCAEEGWQMTKEQEMCPYCHTTTFYTGEAGEMEAEMPEKYFVEEDNEQLGINRSMPSIRIRRSL